MQREGLFEYCTIPPSTIILESTRTKRESALVAINNNAKNTILKLLKRFFEIRKSNNVSIDVYLTKVKEIIDLLEELDVELQETIVIYYMVCHL
uniref:Uncharacterized protein n=1 Tax=Physcomitrium patens TaxID=3218 RepID=A0A2K1KXL8_PHYPA|nr:hypothetical protein PHYPA_005491 [Physcomitrium patens]